MKRLTLVRHAKSSWKDPGLADFDRPLNKRGKRAASLTGKRLAAQDNRPARQLASGRPGPAIRHPLPLKCPKRVFAEDVITAATAIHVLVGDRLKG